MIITSLILLAAVFVGGVFLTPLAVNRDRDFEKIVAALFAPIAIAATFQLVPWYLLPAGLVVVFLGVGIGDRKRSFEKVYPNPRAQKCFVWATVAVILAAVTRIIMFLG